MGVASDGGADSVITMTTTRRAETERVLGVDACRVGWVGVAIGHGLTHTYVAANIADLADRGRRQADILARVTVGPRRGSADGAQSCQRPPGHVNVKRGIPLAEITLVLGMSRSKP